MIILIGYKNSMGFSLTETLSNKYEYYRGKRIILHNSYRQVQCLDQGKNNNSVN